MSKYKYICYQVFHKLVQSNETKRGRDRALQNILLAKIASKWGLQLPLGQINEA